MSKKPLSNNDAGTWSSSKAIWLIAVVIAVVVIALVGIFSWRRASPRSRQSPAALSAARFSKAGSSPRRPTCLR